jgi:cytochrome P450
MATIGEVSRPTGEAACRWPGPRGHWLLGCLRPIQGDPLNFYRQTWRTYGDYSRIRAFPGYDLYFLADPAAVEHVLSKNHKNYRKPDLLLRPLRLLAGNGILTSEGAFWLRQRRLSQPAFLRDHLGRLSSHMVAATDALIREWEQAEDGRTLDITLEMMHLGLRIASTSLFGSDISDDADAIGRAYRVAFAYVSRKMGDPFLPPLWVPTRYNREFRRCQALLDRVVLQLIASRRRAGAASNDVLDLLLASQDEESGRGMTDQQLRDEVLTLLTAGHETAGAALSWAWYLLARHPEVQQALSDEASARLHGRTPLLDDLPHLPQAAAVFEETLRLYPPAWGLAREAIGADEINGYPVPARALLTLSQWVIHRHPAFWSEPDSFRPERFLPSQAQDRPRFAYFPFGGGPRTCIGNHFALVEGPLVLAALAQRFRLTLAPDQGDVLPDPTFTLRPKSAVKVVVCRRA